MSQDSDDVREMLRREVRGCVRERIAARETPPGEDPEQREKKLSVLSDSGYMGIIVPAAYGGEGGGWREAAIVVEETAGVDPVLAMMLAAHQACCSGIVIWGEEGQKKRWLPSLSAGDMLGGLALTEPEAGSDMLAVRTNMETKGELLVIDGNKCFVTNTGPGLDSCILTVCRSAKSLGAVIVPSGAPGFHLVHRYRFAGWDGLPNHAVLLQDCEVPAENLLRESLEPEELQNLLDRARLLSVAMATGMARACFEEASAYAGERRQGGKPLVGHQSIYFSLADMATSIEIMCTGLMHAAAALDEDRPCHGEIAMLKAFSSTRLEEVASSAVEIAGGYGYTTDSSLSTLYRDCKGLQLYWGSRNLMRLEIASELGLTTADPWEVR